MYVGCVCVCAVFVGEVIALVEDCGDFSVG